MTSPERLRAAGWLPSTVTSDIWWRYEDEYGHTESEALAILEREEKRDAVGNASERSRTVEADPGGSAVLEGRGKDVAAGDEPDNRMASTSQSISAPESAEQFFERTMASGATSRAPVDQFVRKNMFEFADRYAASINAAPARKLWIDSINQELGNLREWANAEAKRAEAAEAKVVEVQTYWQNLFAESCQGRITDIEIMNEKIDELRAERERLKEALRKYGRHVATCPHVSENMTSNSDCTCGWRAALADPPAG